jgi:hypothetical protein
VAKTADVFSKKKRSEVMSRIRSRGNRDTELALAKLLRRHGITGWRRHSLVRVASGKWQVTRKARASVLSPVTRHSPSVLTLSSQNPGRRCSWTAVSGMAARNTQPNRKTIALSGGGNWRGTKPATGS